jgi:hypothetical protein
MSHGNGYDTGRWLTKPIKFFASSAVAPDRQAEALPTPYCHALRLQLHGVESMSYTVNCECGAPHEVSANQAGANLACSCGRTVNVPALSSLRKSVGETPVPMNTIQTIQMMLRNGELPSNAICPYSGRPANETMIFHVQCERTWTRGGDPNEGNILYGLLAGFRSFTIAATCAQPAEQLGRETSLELPIRISSDVREKLKKNRRQKKLRALLQETPIYSQLLQEFPEATVTPETDD